MRHDRGEPGAGPEHHPVGVQDGVDGLRDGRRVVRDQVHGLHLAARQRHGRLSADGVHVVRPQRIMPLDQCLEFQRHGGHGQHPPLRAEQLADQVQGLDVVAELLPQGDDQQVADGVPVQVALATGSGAG